MSQHFVIVLFVCHCLYYVVTRSNQKFKSWIYNYVTMVTATRESLIYKTLVAVTIVT